MIIKTAKFEMGGLLKAAQEENAENLQIAQSNVNCGFAEMEHYKSAANRALIQGMNELIALVEGTDAS